MTNPAAGSSDERGRGSFKPSRPRSTSSTDTSSHAGRPHITTHDDAPTSRATAAWEIVSVTLSALIAEWVVYALAGADAGLYALTAALPAFAFMLLSQRARGETARDLGWRLDNFKRATWLLAAPTLAAAFFLLLAGSFAGSINFSRLRGGWALVWLPALGILWGLVQQYALQSFVNRRAQILFGRGSRSVLLVAAVFALAHVPNPLLTAFTFLGGIVWAHVYQRAPNLPALAVSHALMTLVLVSTLPPELLGGLRVGYKYFG